MNQQRILLAFFSELEASKLDSVLKMLTSFSMDLAYSYDEAMASYDEHKHEFIILDHKTKNGNYFFEDILTKNTQQKIVLISDTLRCPILCDDCLSDFKFLRMVKPIDYKHLIPFLDQNESFECINQHRFDKVNTINDLSELLYLEDNLVYNDKDIVDNRLILTSKEEKYDTNFLLREYELIENIISNGYFKLKLHANNSIIVENI